MIDWLNQNQGFVMALLTLAYVVATMVMMRAMIASTRVSQQALALAQATERSRTRPYVFFDIEIRDGLVFAVLRNTGRSPALDVAVSLTPVLTHNAGSSRKESGLTKHKQGLLAPGRSLVDFIDTGPNFFGAYPGDRTCEGNISYRDTDGQSYSEPVLVDLKVHEDIFFTSSKDAAKELAKIAEILQRLAARIKPAN